MIFIPGGSIIRFLFLSPQASGAEIKLTAELKIECIEASVHGITAALTSFMQMYPRLFETPAKLQYPCKSNAILTFSLRNSFVWLDNEYQDCTGWSCIYSDRDDVFLNSIVIKILKI